MAIHVSDIYHSILSSYVFQNLSVPSPELISPIQPISTMCLIYRYVSA